MQKTDAAVAANASDRRTASWRLQIIALLSVAVASPIVVAIDQWAFFAHLNRQPIDWRSVAVPWLFFASIQALLAIATIAAAILIRARWWKTAWLIFLAWLLVVYIASDADRQTYSRTNVHLREYATLLRTPGATQWGGHLHVTRNLTELATNAVCKWIVWPLAGGILAALLLRRFAAVGVVRRVAVGVTLAWIVSIVGVVPAQWLDRDRATLVRAHALMPFEFRWLSPGVAFADAGAFGAAFASRLGAAAPQAANAGRVATTQRIDVASDARRDVLLVIVESLRVDAMSADVMPRTFALAQRGMRLADHVSGAKYTQFAIYNLLSGRPALRFATDADTNAPLAAATFRQLGYATQYVGSSDFHWRGLDKFIDARTFDRMRNVPLADWPAADHLVLKAVRDDVGTGAPRFTVAYLTSTHFPYARPSRFAIRTPEMSDQRNLLSMDEATDRPALINRYHNACGFLDDEIATLLAGIDLSRTVVAITGDHAESFWDDHSLSHGGRWSDVAVHVPCLLLGAGVPQGVQCDRPTSHQDVMPTLLRLATGRHVPVDGCIGRDLFEPAADNDDASGGVRLLCSESNAQFGQALFERGDRRLLVEFPNGPREPIVLGSVDRLGNVNPYDAPPASDAAAWAAGIARLFQPLRQTVETGDDRSSDGLARR